MFHGLVVIAAFVISSSPTMAGWNSGNDVLGFCRAMVTGSKNFCDRGACDGYLAGLHDFQQTSAYWDDQPERWCLPEGITIMQLARVVVRHLEAQPEKLHLSAGGLVGNAFAAAFPCEPTAPPSAD